VNHQHFVCSDRGLQDWDPYSSADPPLADGGYFGGVLRELERHWDHGPLTVYMTKDTESLPSYGEDVLVILLNEEWFRTPAYASQVLATLRTLPGHPWFPWSTLTPPNALGMFALANYLRVLAERARSERRTRRVLAERHWPWPSLDNVFDVPLGYYRQPELPIKPLQERASDVYFGGSLLHDLDRKERWKRVAKRVLGNPKQLYRKHMLDELERVCQANPGIRAKVTVSGEFRALPQTQVTDYAAAMMDARVALVPRGTAAESYRLFEAWRYGCIVICEQLPPRPFLQGAPAITLRSWRELGQVLPALLADSDRQQALHEASLRWWRDVCSEQAVGRRLASQLSALAVGTRGLGGRAVGRPSAMQGQVI
jgi:hypothetical protein